MRRNDEAILAGGLPFSGLEKGLLLTVADEGSTSGCNPMTVSWGAMGRIFGENALLLTIRPCRYTAELLRKTDALTLSALPEGERFRAALALCGGKSGREGSKWEAAGLTPAGEGDFFFPAEAEAVLCCRLLGVFPMDAGRFLPGVWPELRDRFYRAEPLHSLYLCRIEALYQREESASAPISTAVAAAPRRS